MFMNSHRPTSPAGTADAADGFSFPPKPSAGQEFPRALMACMGLSAMSGVSAVVYLLVDSHLLATAPMLGAIAFGTGAIMAMKDLCAYNSMNLKSICDERMAVDNYRMAASTYRQRLLELERVNRIFKSAAVDIPYAECEIMPFNKRVH